jgi:hypothetical protein
MHTSFVEIGERVLSRMISAPRVSNSPSRRASMGGPTPNRPSSGAPTESNAKAPMA